jgi:long-chain acyl-CoA synthetase
MGNYMSGGTTIALYDTLGADAARFVVNQTQLTTIVCSADLIKNIVKLKTEDPNSQMTSLVNVVSFEAPA